MYQRILVPFDGSQTAWAGYEEALRVAAAVAGRIRLLHVPDVLRHASGFESGAAYVNDVLPALRAEGQRILDRAMQRAAALGVPTEACVHHGAPDDVTAAVIEQARAWNADLIALGTHGRRGLDRLEWGSEAEQIARRASVPVLMVRAPASRAA